MTRIIPATRFDKTLVIDILTKSFNQDPQINWIIGAKRNATRRLKRLMAYAFEEGMTNGKIYLTEDKNAVAIWRNHHSSKTSMNLIVEEIRFLMAFGFRRLKKITGMTSKIAQHYPKDVPFDYLWFIGTTPEEQGKGYGSALLNPALQDAKQNKKEVYLETSVDRNVKYYENKGFKVYNSLAIGKEEIVFVFLMKRE